MTSHSFFIPDTSPLFDYGTGWQAAYMARGDGYDQTFHRARSADSVVTFNISASSVYFSSSSPSGQSCHSTYSINGSDPKSACSNSSDVFMIPSLPDGIHEVTLQPNFTSTTSDTDVIYEFYGIGGDLQMIDLNAQYVNATTDSSATEFTFSPSTAWTQFDSSGVIGSASNSSLNPLFQNMDSFFNKTASVTTAANATAELKFQAAAVYLYGMSGPDGGLAQILLDGVATHQLDLNTPWNSYSSLLYHGSGFNPQDQHTLTVVNTTPGSQLILDFAILTVESSSSSLYVLFVASVGRANECSINKHLNLVIGVIGGSSAVLLLLGVFLYFCLSRRNQKSRSVGTTPREYGFQKGILDGDDSSQATSVAQWRRHTSVMLSSPSRHEEYRSPPPDYIPYNGPVEPHPHPQPAPQSPSSFRSDTDPQPAFEEIPLETPSTLGLVGVATSRSLRRSTARLWLNSGKPMSAAPSYTSAGNLAPNPHLQLMGMASRDRESLNTALRRGPLVPSAGTSESHHTTLRRGVSVKSVKTVRSFFSGWFNHSPVPATPALPQLAARPDSDIFPMTLTRARRKSDASSGHSPDFFIELDPNSPIGTSRPASEWRAGR
ncbi:hypothetical protein P7C73_g6100, partial [Tremellales sp. Uapishka_1]